MLIFDAHNDLASVLYKKNASLFKNNFHIDLERLLSIEEYKVALCCAIFVNPMLKEQFNKRFCEILDYFTTQINQNHDKIGLLEFDKKVCVIYSVEGGEVFEGNLENLDSFYKKGLRVASLTWNYTNELSGGCLEPKIGLTNLGKRFLEKMSRLNMILDVSHISDRAFEQICSLYKGKMIASHSNARAICDNIRNLTNRQLYMIKQKKGIVGINLYPPLVGNMNKCKIDDVIMHIEHIAGLIGVEHVGFGFDFDGVDYLPEGIRGVEDVNKIIDYLLRLNYSYKDVEKIAGENFYKMITNV